MSSGTSAWRRCRARKDARPRKPREPCRPRPTDGKESSMSEHRGSFRTLKRRAGALILGLVLSCGTATAKDNVSYHGGATLVDPVRVFFIFWRPSGVIFDNSVSDGLGNFRGLLENFVVSVSATPYLAIAKQYTSLCSGPTGKCAI